MVDRRVVCGQLRAVVAGLVAVVVLTAGSAWAQFDEVPDRPMRLIGYWDRATSDPAVIGTVPISGPTGGTPRNFGITSVQAYAPDEEGMQLFNPSDLQAVTLRAVGKADVVTRFMQAKPNEKVTAFGQYIAGSGTFILGTVTVGDPPAPSPSPAP